MIPQAPRRIPRGPLWWCLLMPTIVTLISVLISAASGTSGYAYSWWLLPLLSGPIAGLVFTPWFVKLLRIRYSGRSLVLMAIAYPFAQLVITPAIGFGGCFLSLYAQ